MAYFQGWGPKGLVGLYLCVESHDLSQMMRGDYSGDKLATCSGASSNNCAKSTEPYR